MNMDWIQILGIIVVIALYAILGGTIAVMILRSRAKARRYDADVEEALSGLRRQLDEEAQRGVPFHD